MQGYLTVGSMRIAATLLLTALAAACSNTPVPGNNVQSARGSARTVADLQVVDCLLSGQVRKLGQQMTFLTAGRAIKTTAADCEIRGGEYVAYDRSTYVTALNVWLPQAQAGDATAQNYVGEIYEKGLGTAPDFSQAAQWYRKAAEQGHSRAQINLAYLYEKGQGVQKDFAAALRWYRQASGLGEGIALDTGESEQLQQTLTKSRQSEAALRAELQTTRKELEQARAALRKRKAEAAVQERRWEQARNAWTQEQAQARQAGDDAGVRRLQAQLDAQAAQVQQSRAEISRLEQEAAHYKDQAQALTAQQNSATRVQGTDPFPPEDSQQTTMDQGATSTAPEPGLTGPRLEFIGPRIEIIEPPITLNRGVGAKIKLNGTMERALLGKATSSLGIRELTVNGRSTAFDEQGLFRTAVRVQSPETPVSVVATDQGGKRANVQFQFVVDRGNSEPEPVVPPERSASVSAGKYYALLIGNNDYQHLSTLNTPVHDVQALGQVLQSSYGFTVTQLHNATRWQLLSALHTLRGTLTAEDNVVIYYAGHGDLDKVNQRGHWLPVDAESRNPANWISNVEVTDAINLMPARRVMVIADSCYSGTLTRSALTSLADSSASTGQQSRWLNALTNKRSRTVFSSGGEMPVPDTAGDDPQHSLFAAALLQVLTTNRELLEGARLYREVAARMAFAAQRYRITQKPGYAPVKYAGHEAGDFVFIPAAQSLSSNAAILPALVER